MVVGCEMHLANQDLTGEHHDGETCCDPEEGERPGKGTDRPLSSLGRICGDADERLVDTDLSSRLDDARDSLPPAIETQPRPDVGPERNDVPGRTLE